MNVEQLIASGAVRPTELIKKEITWARIDESSGDELVDVFDVHVRRLAYIDQERMLRMAFRSSRDASDDDEDAVQPAQHDSTTAALICVAIRLGDDASEELTYDQARQLEPNLARAMLDAINLVNPTPVKKKALARGSSLARAGAKRGRGKNSPRGQAKSKSS
ncbi:hypothetical protein PHACT_12540 [Pseudohongiella acticola]|uniref:Tail assembly chaperone n=1 Tax=Pseudohongiella acticola TaxID=1524254 RepID=A0A1E8CGB8_9GAMM|nr:phage tail assembly chaperone family protein, TAC [Pseudohongiella acticola]OFE11379.1 hypothetical protein PHACT_12540 [Pseudohongiella acticola]